mmetsp:Transcript_139171/g.242199  ORF Transcript_139171/g.242199 Transcript_139171/m.242199 type:complete len:335 (+) Transcript_139171:88-1092(+)
MARSYPNVRIEIPSSILESDTKLDTPKLKLPSGLGHLTVNGDAFMLMFQAGKQNSAKKLGKLVRMDRMEGVTYMLTVCSLDSLHRTYLCTFPSQQSAAAFSKIAESAMALTNLVSDLTNYAEESKGEFEIPTSLPLKRPCPAISLADELDSPDLNRRVEVLYEDGVAVLHTGAPCGEFDGSCASSHAQVTELVEELARLALPDRDVASLHAGRPSGHCLGSCPPRHAQVTELAEELVRCTFPNSDEAEWQRRCEKRRAAIDMIKASPEYELYSSNRARLSLSAVSLPRTPSPGDRSVTKRRWEQNVSSWRSALRSCCASDGAKPDVLKGKATTA